MAITPSTSEHGHQDISPTALLDVFSFVARQARWIVAFVILGGIIGFVVASLLPKQWEATTVLQMGQILDRAGDNLVAKPIEPAATAVERLSAESSRDELMTAMGLPIDQNATSEAKLVRDSMSATVVRGSELVALSIRAHSAEQARSYVGTFASQLIQTHQKLTEPWVRELQSRHDVFAREIKERQALLRQLYADGHGSVSAEGKRLTNNSVLLTALVSQNEQMLNDLERRSQLIEAQLNASRTFVTRPLVAISVSLQPVFPKRGLFVGAFAFVGLLLGCVVGKALDLKRVR